MDLLDGISGSTAEKARASEPICEIAPPEKLDGRERKIWRHLCEGLAAEGRLKQKDSVAIYRICRAYVLWQDARREVDKIRRDSLIMTTPKGYRQMDAAIAVERSLGKDLDDCLDAMGLNMTAFAPANLRFVQAERLHQMNQMALFGDQENPVNVFAEQLKDLGKGSHVH